MAGKYTPLENYLCNLPDSHSASFADFVFSRSNRILNTKLPASAYEDQRWWEQNETEGNHITKRAWVNAGLEDRESGCQYRSGWSLIRTG